MVGLSSLVFIDSYLTTTRLKTNKHTLTTISQRLETNEFVWPLFDWEPPLALEMKFTEAQLEAAIIELLGANEPKGSSIEL